MQIAYPRGLINSFWKEPFLSFFNRNNIQVNYSPPSNDILFKKGKSFLLDEFCLPVKLFAGHVLSCMESSDDPVFIPFISGNTERNSFLCPLKIRITDILINSGVMDRSRLLSPSFVFDDNLQLSFVWRNYPGSLLNIPFEDFQKKSPESSEDLYGSNVLSVSPFSTESKNPRILVLGRNYILDDPWLNRRIPERISFLGLSPILPEDIPGISGDIRLADYNHFAFSARQLQAVEYLARKEIIDGVVVLKSFLCGPDCSLENDIFRFLPEDFHKPVLELVLDETRSEEGFQTRLEAFADMVHKIKESA